MRYHELRIVTLLTLPFLLTGCARRVTENFPPMVRAGIYPDVSVESLWAAILEHADVNALAVRETDGFARVLTTDWSPVDPGAADTSLHADCEGALERATPTQMRFRSRFAANRRGGRSLLRVEAHWQVSRAEGLEDGLAWRNCRSTGVWERMVEERLSLRARNIR